MSGRNDLRMYVEHLFEGRTLDAETIELKEEIYGNLVARFDDYVAQGMDADEAYRRTCEAVTSVEDVLDGEKGGAAEAGTDATVVAPVIAPADAPGAEKDVPPAPTAAPTAPQKRRWSTGAIVAVAVVGVLIVGMIAVTVFNLLSTDDARTACNSSTDETVQQVADDDAPVYQDDSQNDAADDTTTPSSGNGRGNGNGTGDAPQDGTGNGHGATAEGSTGLMAEVLAHSSEDLAAYANTGASDTARLQEVVRGLPLGTYASEVTTDAGTKGLSVTYSYQQDRDLLARNDDHVDAALVYDVAALMCAAPDLASVSVTEIEPDDDGGMDYDLHVFERSMLEGLLGTTLDGSKLSSGPWDELRAQLMTERVYDAAWDRADRD